MVCVTLDSGGQQVAGTQNDLVWDGKCATLTKGSCQVAAPKKQLNDAFPPGASFTMRAFVLALDNLDPIPNGNLYCCNFISELSSSGSCPIRISNALGADPKGNPVQVSTIGGQIRYTGSGSGGTGGGGPGAAPGVAGGGGVVGGLVGQGGGGGAPQVYQGGGPSTPPTPIVIEPSGQQPPPAAEQAPEAGEPEAALNETPQATASVQPTSAATEAPTKAPTKPAGTPTAKPTVKPTAPPAAAQEAAKKEDSGGWFSCQVTTGQSTALPHALLAVLGFLAVRLKRRKRR
jgi:MYXO-CTERM domain-containing protein